MKLNNIILACISVFILASCGSSGGSATNATFNDIIGTWQETDDDGDIFVTVMRNDGTFTDYDYMGDTFDNGLDCYIDTDGGMITDLGNGDFVVDDGFGLYNLHITISGDTLYVRNPYYDSRLVKINMTEAQIQLKLC